MYQLDIEASPIDIFDGKPGILYRWEGVNLCLRQAVRIYPHRKNFAQVVEYLEENGIVVKLFPPFPIETKKEKYLLIPYGVSKEEKIPEIEVALIETND